VPTRTIIITSDSTALNPNNHPAQMQQTQQQQLYDNRINTQVKTYTDHGNGHSVIRTGNSSHYSKVSLCCRLSSKNINKIMKTIQTQRAEKRKNLQIQRKFKRRQKRNFGKFSPFQVS
jgi:hypothetical protein